jgi:acyl-CoA thioesterase
VSQSAADGTPDSVTAMMAADSASRAMGIEVTQCGDGRATARMTVRADMVNGHGIAHGGMLFSLADTAFACACNSFGPVAVAAAAEIVFVAPARLGDELTATAARRVGFGRSGLYDVTVRCGDQVIAEFRGHSQQVSLSRHDGVPGATSADGTPR